MYSPFFLLGGDFKTLKKSPPGWFLNTNKQLMSTIPCSNFKIFLSFKLKAYVFYIISVHFPNQSHLQAESRRGSFLLTHKRGECWDLGIHGEETLSIRSWPNTSIFSSYVLGVISLSPLLSENCFAEGEGIWLGSQEGLGTDSKGRPGAQSSSGKVLPWTPWQLLGGFCRLYWGRGWAEQRSSTQPRTATNTLIAIPPEHGNVWRN